ncbi:hypothetical protein FM036_43060, partial [Nostoc sp. HG1]|nr:hypothetical protein [Nostoc sp. HG1]
PPNPTTKSNNPSPKPELVAYRPAEQHPVTLQLDPSPSDEPQLPDVQQAMPLATFSTNAEKVLPLEKGKAHIRYRPRVSDKASNKSDDARQSKQHHFERSDELELPPERCQHIQFLNCNSSVGRVIFECWHCQQGILCEFTGEPVMGEYKGRPSLIQL